MARLLKGNSCCFPSLGLAVVDVDDVAAAACLALFQPNASGRLSLAAASYRLLYGLALLCASPLLPHPDPCASEVMSTECARHTLGLTTLGLATHGVGRTVCGAHTSPHGQRG